jgi:hypothetical protein
MERYCTRNPKSCSFSASDIPDFRVQIAIDTLFNDYNSEVEEMDFISTFDLEVTFSPLHMNQFYLFLFSYFCVNVCIHIVIQEAHSSQAMMLQHLSYPG